MEISSIRVSALDPLNISIKSKSASPTVFVIDHQAESLATNSLHFFSGVVLKTSRILLLIILIKLYAGFLK